MKSVKIKIERLGAIRDSEISIKQLMLFTGESGLGKSYAAFLVHYFYVLLLTDRFKYFFSEKNIDFSNILKGRKSGENLLVINTKELFEWINKDAVVFIGYLIGHKLDGEVKYEIPYTEKRLKFVYNEEIFGLYNNEEVYYRISLNSLVYRIASDSYNSSYTPFLELLKAELVLNIFEGEERIRNVYLMPPSRGALMELDEKPNFRSGMYDEFFKLKAALIRPLSNPPVIPPTLIEMLSKVNDGTLDRVNGNWMYYTNGGAEIPLTAAASSIKELAPFTYYIGKYSAKDSSILLEEPEAHLHPSRQSHLADLIAYTYNEGCHLQITTHSDYFLKRLNHLIRLNLLKYRLDDSTEFKDLLKKWSINEKCLINPINIATYLFIRNDDGTSKIERKFVSVDNQISFDSFYNTVMNDIELTSDINQFY